MRLYSQHEIDQIPWPNTFDGQYAKEYLSPFLRDGTKPYIDNVDVEFFVLIFNEKVLPVCRTGKAGESCYVCSPYDHYITYALEELAILKSPLLVMALRVILKSLGAVLKVCAINEGIYVNNWLLSTNLYTTLTKQEVKEITQFLQELFPKTPILYRSLNEFSNEKLIHYLKADDYRLVLSRQIYLIDLRSEQQKISNELKKDLKLLKRTPYEILENGQINEEEMAQVVDCYNQLYLGKYTFLNPQFTTRFISLATRKKLLFIKAFRLNKKIDAVLGYFVRNRVMTTPLFGYKTGKPKKLGLYRQISASLNMIGSEKKLILNRSSGVASYKVKRGASPYLEFLAVNYKTASWKQKLGWRILSSIINAIAIPLMRGFKL